MDLTFDISEDELPVFLAETDEQLQTLDEGLVRLETEVGGKDLLQTLFRAAHTLKGSAGIIGHKRMVEVTHALETAMDGLRKEQISISTALIDTCLEAIDILRLLRDEVVQPGSSPVEVAELARRLSAFGQAAPQVIPQPGPNGRSKPANSPANSAANAVADAVVDSGSLPAIAASGAAPASAPASLIIQAEISQDSIAPAARAFQLLLACQELGEIVRVEPSQAEIESFVQVQTFTAEIIPGKPVDEIRRVLGAISEIERLNIGSIQLELADPSSYPAAGIFLNEEENLRLGDLLVHNGLISEGQLQQALEQRAKESGPAALLGHTLIRMGLVNQEVLDQVVAEQKQQKAEPRRAADSSGEERQKAYTGEKTIRTSVERLDILMNLVGELITDRNRLFMIRSDLDSCLRGNGQIEMLSETITHVSRITDQLQAEVMGIRMLPISNVFNKFPRLVRDLARKANKQVDLVIRGEDTELDRSVIEEINDPLIHLLRNAVDHGLETSEERLAAGKPERGVILLTARHEQGRIILTVEDDGHGIDLEQVKAKAVEKGLLSEKDLPNLSDEEAVDLIFVPGLSTARAVSDISGRGVGMDIVRNNIERLNGNIMVETWPGRGTQFQIVLPLTLAIVPTLLVRVGSGVFAIPLVTVIETLRVTQAEIHSVNSRPVILLRDHVLPVVQLSEVFHSHHSSNGHKYKYIVVVRSGKLQVGLIVDSLVGEQEVVVKSLSSVVGDVPGISSAAILGDGQIALILDVQGVLKGAAAH